MDEFPGGAEENGPAERDRVLMNQSQLIREAEGRDQEDEGKSGEDPFPALQGFPVISARIANTEKKPNRNREGNGHFLAPLPEDQILNRDRVEEGGSECRFCGEEQHPRGKESPGELSTLKD